ncbi:hypothetical protein BDZ89DRAFT_1117421 [Hymenopellis radicata]|nr:hypothetical protein BDZ89DRAFT_1117421 [Hymenopellis radicata]
MAFLQLPSIPEARANAEKWNSHWEQLLEKQLPAFAPEAIVAQRYNEILFNGHQDRQSMAYANHFETTCTLRLFMAKEFFVACATDHLVTRWTSASLSERRKHVLLALVSVCTIAKDLHDSRMSCPELTLDHLSQDPKVLLNLITALVPDGFDFFSNVPLGTIFYIPNPAWDELGRQEHTFNELQKLVYRDQRTLRTKLIYLVIQHTYLSFIGRGPPPTTVLKEREKPKEEYGKILSDAAMKADPSTRKQRSRIENIDHKNRLKDRRVVCAGCRRAQMNGEANFMQCSSCKSKMSRDVPYCSKECQKAHWKAHKVICGKPLNVDVVHESLAASPQPTPTSPYPYKHVTIGPPVAPFKRSLELNVHIVNLAAADSLTGRADFIVELDGQGGTFVFTFPRTPAAAYTTCVNARELAMTTGDRAATAALCHFVLWVFGAKKKMTIPQLEWPLWRMSVEFGYPDLGTAVQELSKKQENDLHRRAPLFFDFSEEDWTAVLKDLGFKL